MTKPDHIFLVIIMVFLMAGMLVANINKYNRDVEPDPFRETAAARIGDYPYPTNPMNDRGIGYLLQGKVNNALTNYGNFINWDEHPSGIWGEYSYLPAVAFLAGVPGHLNSSNYTWINIESIVDNDGFILYGVWESQGAYSAWYANGDTNYVGIIYDIEEDYGRWEPDSVSRKLSADQITDAYQ
ncbi:MAG TPA: hypothetical protein EYO07_00730, partial [Candidatus Marinimicrobia bacterium]|nr:hypothetical protein [Candidatus Neomarinimicrobiota bacterium]